MEPSDFTVSMTSNVDASTTRTSSAPSLVGTKIRSPSETDKLPDGRASEIGRRRHGCGCAVDDDGGAVTAVAGKEHDVVEHDRRKHVDRERDRASDLVRRGIHQHCGRGARLAFVVVVAPGDHEFVRCVGLATVDAELDRRDRLERLGVVAVEALAVADPHRAVDDPAAVGCRPDIGLRQARDRRCSSRDRSRRTRPWCAPTYDRWPAAT